MLIIGKNDGWKQQITIGRRNNQYFVLIPYARFIQMLQYKAELVGIEVGTINESHLSKCSFLDAEPIGHRDAMEGGGSHAGWFTPCTATVWNGLRYAFTHGLLLVSLAAMGDAEAA